MSLANIKKYITNSFNTLNNIKIDLVNFILLVSFINSILYTFPIYRKLTDYNFSIPFYTTISILLFILSIGMLNVFYSLLIWKKFSKPIVIITFLCNSAILYFMNTYNIAIDSAMIINFFETNVKEATGFLTSKILIYIATLGAIPSIFIYKLKLEYHEDFLKKKIKIFLYSLLPIILIIGPCYLYRPAFLFLRHNQKSLTFLLPVNYTAGFIDYELKMFKKYKFSKKPKMDISSDATMNRKSKNNKKNLVVFIVGESARADHFSINGYKRDTNYFLNNYKKDIISFKNFTSYDSLTETTLSYTFSHKNRDDFDFFEEFGNETLLHILNKVGIKINWRTNNGRCKQIACLDGTVNHSIVKSFGTELYDDLLIKAFDFLTSENRQKNEYEMIFLHQWGSHGPDYKEKYREEFEKWTPICTLKEVNKCSKESLTNIYDNTIYFTSYVISEVIKKLETMQDKYNVMLIYMSDHGESLGENGIYMHATHPLVYEQINPAFFLWIPNSFAKEYNINKKCLKDIKNYKFSQDNIFHSIIGLFSIKSKYYNKNLDIFYKCKN